MKHIAVMIDAENISAKHWPVIRERLATLGTIAVCRIFGNFTGGLLQKWVEIAQDEAMQPVLQFSGPNASDIALTVSAMDLMHSGKLQGMCIVSSDGDFTPLVHRLKAGGISVYGIGKDKAPQGLQKACTSFITISELIKPAAVPQAA